MDEVAMSSLVPRRCPYFILRLAPASSRMAFKAQRGMVGIGGAVLLVLSVRTVREDELEARLVVEAEGRMKLERRLSAAFWPSFSFSWVADDDVEMIDRRFAMLRRFFLSSASSLPLPSSVREEPGLGIGVVERTTSVVPMETVDGGDEEGDECEAESES